MGALQPIHLVVVLVIVLIVFGAGRLPEVGAQLGRGIRDFRQATDKPPQPVTAGLGQVCAACGKASAAGATFCTECGKRLGVPAEPTARAN